MKFTDSKLKDITSKIDSRCGEFECPICKNKSFDIDRDIIHLPSYPIRGNEVEPGDISVRDCVAYICKNCGHVVLFSID